MGDSGGFQASASGGGGGGGIGSSPTHGGSGSPEGFGRERSKTMQAIGGEQFLESYREQDAKVTRLLDSRFNKEKLEGMSRLVSMMAAGRDVSTFFPAVVKNVVADSMEVKKLVYMFLTHYAELKPEIALLSINTFQKELTDKNQFTRALALRVMSSIRVHVIVQLMMLAIRKCASDPSAYVRKIAANAIPKVYSLDQDEKENLTEILNRLLEDKSTLVLSSAVAAFLEVNPHSLHLIHRHYRKLCQVLPDTDEWGQVVLVNMLLRYARTQFCNPNAREDEGGDSGVEDRPFYSDSDDDAAAADVDAAARQSLAMDSDHRLLLRSVAPLLSSQNDAVVMAASALFFYLAPYSESTAAGRALVRISRSSVSPEVEYVVLSNIATMASLRPQLFVSQLSSFFIRTTDRPANRALKLETMTHLANSGNIHAILREFQVYVRSDDTEFAAATIAAIGRCASALPEVADTCLTGLMALITSPSEAVVGKSVVVMRELLQMQPAAHGSIIRKLAKLLPSITVESARASIVWIVGEYCDQLGALAAETLRRLAKSFAKEGADVKMQTLALGAKLFLRDGDTVQLLFTHVLDLARYDLSYDIRDRARLMRTVLLAGTAPLLRARARELFLSTKPPAKQQSTFGEDRQRFVMNSLSHIVNHTAYGYLPLPDWPTEQPDPSVRDSAAYTRSGRTGGGGGGGGAGHAGGDDSFYSDSDSGSYTGSGSSYTGSGSFYSDDDSDSASGSSTGSGSDSYTGSGSDSGSYTGSSSSGGGPDLAPTSVPHAVPRHATLGVAGGNQATNAQATGELLEMFNSDAQAMAGAAVMTALSPLSNNSSSSSVEAVEVVLPRHELIHHANGSGLGVEYQFSRATSMYGAHMNAVRLYVTNHTNHALTNVHVSKQPLDGTHMEVFQPIATIGPLGRSEANIYVDFKQRSSGVRFEMSHDHGSFSVEIKPPAGELLCPVEMSIDAFAAAQKKLGGMHQTKGAVTLMRADAHVAKLVLAHCNLFVVENNKHDDVYKFAGREISVDSEKCVVLVALKVVRKNKKATITVSCDNALFSNRLMQIVRSCVGR